MAPNPGLAATPDDRTGQTLAERYLLEELIGQGGMSSVYRAHDQALGRVVTIKIFLPALAAAEDIRRQQDEIRMVATLNHPSLVTLFDAVADIDGRAFLVLEYVDGEDLRERLARGALDTEATTAIGIDVASALAYVHDRGVVHRDVKPGNILISASTTVNGAVSAKLADFGIARLVDAARVTMTGSVLGTASYLSPEQALGEVVSSASDVYSLGLVLLECLTGDKAFPGSGIEAAIARLSRDPDIPASVDPTLAELLHVMTSRDPGGRPAAIEVAATLRDFAFASTADPGGASSAPLPMADASAATARMAVPDATTRMGSGEVPTMAMPLTEYGDEEGNAEGTAEGTGATVAMPPMANLQPTAPMADMQPTPPGSRGHSRSRRRLILAAAGLAAVVLAIVVIVSNAPSKPTDEPATIQYPVVDGPLGEHLRILQESVAP